METVRKGFFTRDDLLVGEGGIKKELKNRSAREAGAAVLIYRKEPSFTHSRPRSGHPRERAPAQRVTVSKGVDRAGWLCVKEGSLCKGQITKPAGVIYEPEDIDDGVLLSGSRSGSRGNVRRVHVPLGTGLHPRLM